jgi:hypothetical protein
MNIIAHLFLGSAVRHYTYKQIGIKLSWSGFLLGNILPDISSSYSHYPHFLKDSAEYIVESAKDICYNTDDNLSLFEFSKQVGVINHYMTDYFCYAHCEDYQEDIYHHHLYEFLMLFALSKGLRSFKKSEQGRQITPYELFGFIGTRAAEYHQGGFCKSKDVDYALGTCSAATLGMMQTSFYLQSRAYPAAFELTH